MPKVLTDSQIRCYRENGYVSPIRAIDEAEAAECRRRLEAYEAEIGARADTKLHFKVHLYFDWLWKLTRSPAILDAVEDLIGPNMAVFSSKFWIKDARDSRFVSWHQDSAYFGLDPHDEVTVWMAVTEVTRDNGCVRVIPGSHLAPAKAHVETYDKNNMLARGQVIEGIDDTQAVDLELRPGEFSIHNERLVHSSLANDSSDRRIGFSWMIIPTHVRSTIGRRSATLVRGEDRHGHWEADPLPTGDRDPVIEQLMHDTFEQYRDRTVKQESQAAE